MILLIVGAKTLAGTMGYELPITVYVGVLFAWRIGLILYHICLEESEAARDFMEKVRSSYASSNEADVTEGVGESLRWQ